MTYKNCTSLVSSVARYEAHPYILIALSKVAPVNIEKKNKNDKIYINIKNIGAPAANAPNPLIIRHNYLS